MSHSGKLARQLRILAGEDVQKSCRAGGNWLWGQSNCATSAMSSNQGCRWSATLAPTESCRLHASQPAGLSRAAITRHLIMLHDSRMAGLVKLRCSIVTSGGGRVWAGCDVARWATRHLARRRSEGRERALRPHLLAQHYSPIGSALIRLFRRCLSTI